MSGRTGRVPKRLTGSALRESLIFGVVAALIALGPGSDAQAAGIRPVDDVCVWLDVDWDELSAEEQKTWTTLGWDQNLWDSDEEAAIPASATKDWTELGGKEQRALTKLGYTQESWDEFDADNCSGDSEDDSEEDSTEADDDDAAEQASSE